MGKKKEIEVYLPPNFNESNGSIHLTRARCRDSGPRATLVFEEPEREIKLTESQFDEAWKEMHKSPKSDYDFLKEKLFGSDN